MHRTTIIIGYLIVHVLPIYGEIESCQVADAETALEFGEEVLERTPFRMLLPFNEEPPAVEHQEDSVILEDISPVVPEIIDEIFVEPESIEEILDTTASIEEILGASETREEILDTSENSDEISDISEETDNLEKILSFVQDIEIPAPDVTKTSFLLVGIRSLGIPFAYKLLAIKDWLLGNVS